MRQTIIGLLMVALTAAGFYMVGRRRYKCPFCGRVVRYQDINCPHCGNDMKYHHRDVPEGKFGTALGQRPARGRPSGGRSSRR